MSSQFRQTVRGMRDFLPDETEKLRFIEQVAREIAKLYGYGEVITPIVEHFELLAAKVGEENRDRMYVFEDQGGRKVALRPEFTASIARLVATKMMNAPRPLRLFSTGSLYRYDEPQFGRYREFWQANYELISSDSPEADAEALLLTRDFLEKSSLISYHFKIGHVGLLRSILNQEGIVEEQQNNIMQLLDKKRWDGALELVRNAGGSNRCLSTLKKLFEIKGEEPNTVIQNIKETVSEYPEALKAVENLREVLNLLKASCEVKMVLDAGFARGLDYYTGIIFEVYVPEMSVALGGGGRYDKLIELFGGGLVPAVGVALGIDRLLLAAEKQGAPLSKIESERILVIPVDNTVVGKGFQISSLLRKAGFCTEIETMGRSVSRALSDAARREITHAVIVGPKEIKEGKVVLRTMKERKQENVSIEKLAEKIKLLAIER